MIDKQRLMTKAEERLLTRYHTDFSEASPYQLHDALSGALMSELARDWKLSEERRVQGRQAFYLSAEYLIGRLIFNNLYGARVLEDVDAMLAEKGASLSALEDIEDDAFGNGGLGRLAACYLDSAATHVYPLTGYGLRYKYGLFKQAFENCRQVEYPDDWSRYGDPWSLRREELSVTVRFGDYAVRAVPYDMPVVGYQTENVGTLRLWQTQSLTPIDLEAFNDQDYDAANAEKDRAEDIVALLYPNDTKPEGQKLRLRQQYVLASASLQDILRAYKARFGDDYALFPVLNVMQLNDTHPVMAIPELIRLLTLDGLSFDDAFHIAGKCFAYTNHTVMKEALEIWKLPLMTQVVPDIVKIIEKIDARLKRTQPGLSIIQADGVHMADLAMYVCSHVNGVARIHTELLKTTVFREWHAIYPEKIVNVTNGVTQRRWLGLCNPELAELIARRLGGNDSFLTDLTELDQLKSKIDEPMIDDFISIKKQKKRQFASWAARSLGYTLDPDFLFDVQIKRLHEYKRQLLNAFSILAIYFELKAGRLSDFTPTAFLLAGKAAPGYVRAKSIIYYINRIAEKINADESVNGLLRVLFLPNYNCSLAEKLIPAADVSEQISTAGTEASGTGNMKLMLNGAVTLGTLDGANIEIVERAGRENNFIFGATVDELSAIADTYNPSAYLKKDALLKKVVLTLMDGTFPDEDGGLKGLYDALLLGASYHKPDNYFLLRDFRPYLEAKLACNRAYADRRAFARMGLENISGAGLFSSDRALNEYADKIWDV